MKFGDLDFDRVRCEYSPRLVLFNAGELDLDRAMLPVNAGILEILGLKID